MIISKAQSQSLKEVDIDLREECFSHMGYSMSSQKIDVASLLEYNDTCQPFV
jgi:hypothetical protein